MKLWPFRRLSFETSLSGEEALRRLHDEIGSGAKDILIGSFNAYVGVDCERRAFLGRVLPDGADFRLNLNIEPGEPRRWNAFQPLVRVRIEPSVRGTTAVHASMRLYALTMLLLLVFAFPIMLVTDAFVSAIVRGEAVPTWGVLIGPAFILLPWLFVSFVFSEEADSAERLLRAMLERD